MGFDADSVNLGGKAGFVLIGSLAGVAAKAFPGPTCWCWSPVDVIGVDGMGVGPPQPEELVDTIGSNGELLLAVFHDAGNV